MDSKVFYNTIRNAFAKASERIEEAGAPRANMFISVTSVLRKGEPSITLSNGEYDQKKIEVIGRDINDIVDEYIRRAGFNVRQERTALAPPVVNASGQEQEQEQEAE